jgi:hypothetical protein
MSEPGRIIGHILPCYIELPTSWAMHFPALDEWPQYIYAGRTIAGLGHRVKFSQLPETKVTLPWGEYTVPSA